MTTYFNLRACGYRETVDELSRDTFKTWKEYRDECRKLVSEYHMAGMPVYASQRMCANWRD